MRSAAPDADNWFLSLNINSICRWTRLDKWLWRRKGWRTALPRSCQTRSPPISQDLQSSPSVTNTLMAGYPIQWVSLETCLTNGTGQFRSLVAWFIKLVYNFIFHFINDIYDDGFHGSVHLLLSAGSPDRPGYDLCRQQEQPRQVRLAATTLLRYVLRMWLTDKQGWLSCWKSGNQRR